MLHILHGEEEFTRTEEVARLKAQVANEGMGDLNISVLDGRKLRLEDLTNACDALPFLGSRRMVVVEGFLRQLDSRARKDSESEGEEGEPPADRAVVEGLLTYLTHLPPSTELVFVESKTLSARNPVLKFAGKAADAKIHQFRPLAGDALQHWVEQRARSKGVSIAKEACEQLTRYVGSDLRALDAELEKLAGHAGYARGITQDDITDLVSAAIEEDVFKLVDALGARNRAAAIEQLERMLAQRANDLYLLSMVARQFRLILATKELVEERRLPLPAVQAELGLRYDFVVKKLTQQARVFTMAEIQRVQERLLDLDQGIKTGRMDGRLGLELLTVEVCRRVRSRASTYQPRSRERTR